MARNTRKIITRSKVRFAPAEAVEDYVAEVSGQVLACRDQKHKWKLYDIEGDRDTGFVRIFRCACKAMLRQTLDPQGYVVHRQTKYPQGYQMPAGTGRLSREGNAIIRLASAEADMRVIAMRKASRKAS